MSKDDLIKAWQYLDLDQTQYILTGDEKLREINAGNLLHNYLTYDEYVNNDDPRSDLGKLRFHTGLVPVPYAGNLSRAKMFFLMANPGFQSLDYFAEFSVAKFKKRVIQNLIQ